jgi:hypothetical protein
MNVGFRFIINPFVGGGGVGLGHGAGQSRRGIEEGREWMGWAGDWAGRKGKKKIG